MELPARPPKKPATKLPPKPPASKKEKAVRQPKKSFAVKTWDASAEGELIILYADSGMGKTTLAALSPTPVFIPLDRGSSKILHPVTKEPLKYVDNIDTFDDFRDALHERSLFADHETVVVDTGTLIDPIALQWTLRNIPHEKGYSITGIESYGWGKGYRHRYDTMLLPLADFDQLSRAGKNIIIICQMAQTEIANAGGENFLCDIPKLPDKHGTSVPSVWGVYCEWADHVLKIDYDNIKTKDGKAVASNSRVVRVHPEAHFKAKSRTISLEYPVVTFDDPTDDSIWQYVWPNKEGV